MGPPQFLGPKPSRLRMFAPLGADPFGLPTLVRPFDDRSACLDNAKRRLRAAFEFMSKLGVHYWTFHDV